MGSPAGMGPGLIPSVSSDIPVTLIFPSELQQKQQRLHLPKLSTLAKNHSSRIQTGGRLLWGFYQKINTQTTVGSKKICFFLLITSVIKEKKAVVTKIQSSEGSLFCLFCNKLSISAIVLI